MLRTLTFHLRVARDVVHGARAYAQDIAALIEPKITAVLEEAKSLPVRWLVLFQLALAALVTRDRSVAVRAERALRQERRKESQERQSREQAKLTLYQLLLKGRTFLEGALEPGASEKLVGLEANLGKVEALVLLRYGAEAHEEFSRPDFRPEALIIGGEVRRPEEYAEEIRVATEELQAAEDRVADQVRQTQEALRVKTEALEKLHGCTQSCGRILEELYSLAGRKFYSERLRRTSRPRPASPEDSDLIDGHEAAAPVEDPDPIGDVAPTDPPPSQDGDLGGEEGVTEPPQEP